MIHRIGFVLAIALAAAAATPAQLSVEVKGIVPQGSTVFTRVEATQPTELSQTCPIEIRATSPIGPIVRTPTCGPQTVVVGPGQAYTNLGWDGKDNTSQLVPPGDYFLRIDHRPANTTAPYQVHWVPVHIDAPAQPDGPILTAPAASRGQILNFTLNAPPLAGSQYWMAASFTTNAGIPLGSLHVALDFDGLFLVSFPNPNPFLFRAFQGTLDATGVARPSMGIPPFAPQGLQVAFQAIVQSGATFFVSNPLTRIVR